MRLLAGGGSSDLGVLEGLGGLEGLGSLGHLEGLEGLKGLKAGVKHVEIIRQTARRADGVGGGPILCDVLQAWPQPPGVRRRIEAIQLLSVLPLSCCNGFPQSILHSFILRLIA